MEFNRTLTFTEVGEAEKLKVASPPKNLESKIKICRGSSEVRVFFPPNFRQPMKIQSWKKW